MNQRGGYKPKVIFAGASTVLILLLKSDLSFVVRVVKKSKSEFCRFDYEMS